MATRWTLESGGIRNDPPSPRLRRIKVEEVEKVEKLKTIGNVEELKR
jgi:hypothetical protein